ncbi:BON domain-containing protein [Nocardia pseudobrasiliensis]|uniref:BON domain-containing protein n=1 Tax=Nocardia pseudobrasiliensis TaxID=45979 RepID=UPI0020D26340|nr:BON domain-containing protein [Nocardia pseudobrasiliensis]
MPDPGEGDPAEKSQVSVEVCHGVVTLFGTVPHPIMIDILIALTSGVKGVVDVRSELLIESRQHPDSGDQVVEAETNDPMR